MQVSRLATATLGASIWIASFLSISAAIAFDDSGKTEQHVETVFAGLRSLKPMQAGKQYTARVSGEEETGKKERFLRRRTSQEIAKSGLSSGCGDHAILFIDRIEAKDFETLLVDAAEISSVSLRNHFSGHAVVAIRSKESPKDAPWWLVDSTSLIKLPAGSIGLAIVARCPTTR